MKAYGGVEVSFHKILIPALDGDNWSVSGPGCWVSLRSSLDNMEMRGALQICPKILASPACSLVIILTKIFPPLALNNYRILLIITAQAMDFMR
jgi:hypothetical protein